MKMLLLAARPREIEKEIKYAKGYQIIKEEVRRDRWGYLYWKIFMCDEWGLMRIVSAATRRNGEIEEVNSIISTIRDIKDAAERAQEIYETARTARLSV